MKRILTIQDISCFGKCSITIALPVLSAMGIETAVLPTALFSTHTMFPDYKKISLDDQMIPFARQWKDNGITFDAIYIGYLGSAQEIDIVREIIGMFREENTLIFTDPVMGDHGKLYRGLDESYVARIKELCSSADIIVPNITEACLLTGTEYSEEGDADWFSELCSRLCELGAGTAVITGVSLSEGKTGVFGMKGADHSVVCYQNDRVEATFHGTGDLFAGTAAGAILKGMSMQEAFEIASDYTAQTIRVTLKEPRDPRYGVHFEETLPMLIELITAKSGEYKKRD